MAAVGDLPEMVRGRIADVRILRGPSVATARVAGGAGRYLASIAKTGSGTRGWRVHTADGKVFRFAGEEAAVAFFLLFVEAFADGDD